MDLGTSLRHTLNLSTENKLLESERDTNIRIKIHYIRTSNDDNIAVAKAVHGAEDE